MRSGLASRLDQGPVGGGRLASIEGKPELEPNPPPESEVEPPVEPELELPPLEPLLAPEPELEPVPEPELELALLPLGHVGVTLTKHCAVVASQQFVLPLGGALHVFWQSASMEHAAMQPPELPPELEFPPLEPELLPGPHLPNTTLHWPLPG